MTENVQTHLIDALPAIITAIAAGFIAIILQLRHITKLTNSALAAQTARAADAEDTIKSLQEAAREVVQKELAALKAAVEAQRLPAQVQVVNSSSEPVPVTDAESKG